jgi:hypothetical protein
MPGLPKDQGHGAAAVPVPVLVWSQEMLWRSLPLVDKWHRLPLPRTCCLLWWSHIRGDWMGTQRPVFPPGFSGSLNKKANSIDSSIENVYPWSVNSFNSSDITTSLTIMKSCHSFEKPKSLPTGTVFGVKLRTVVNEEWLKMIPFSWAK